MLSSFESRAGNEGRVFFVSDEVIVKKYFPKIDNPEVLQKIFNIYCQECERYYKKGYKIPKIYTWSIIQRPDHSGFDYYLMEERVPGRELFISNIVKMYDEFKDLLSKNDFERAVTNPEENQSVYEKILSSYVHDFIEMNQRIESMSDKDLEVFLESIYKMFGECKYAIPDVKYVVTYMKRDGTEVTQDGGRVTYDEIRPYGMESFSFYTSYVGNASRARIRLEFDDEFILETVAKGEYE